MKRILSIDGGGIRALFSIEVLYRIERLLADRFGDPEGFRLCQYFDFMAGTSTGAIVCAMLSWGYRVEEVRDMYLEHGRRVFTPNRPWRLWKARFTADPLTALLKGYFVERDGSPALLGSRQLKTLLLIVMRNMSTGSPWPVTNNPRSLYNDRSLADCNLNIPLWQLIRASTAAPTYFPPETVTLGEQTFSFVDGGISPYNNPSLIAFLMKLTFSLNRVRYSDGVYTNRSTPTAGCTIL